MEEQYEKNLVEIKRNIIAQKTIYKFRNLFYSINKDIRKRCFEICRDYMENEILNIQITVTEKERLNALLIHWNWNQFEINATHWWNILSKDHSHSTILLTFLHLWIDDIDIFDSEAFETSTAGIR